MIPNGIDPDDLQPHDGPELERLRSEFAAPGRAARAAGRPARLREGLPDRARGDARADRARSRRPASSSPARARTRRSCARQAERARARRSTAPSSAGSATTSCTRSTGSPTSASSRRSTSRSGSSRSRRWRPAAPASSPTPAACARSCPTTRSGCASGPATPERSSRSPSACSPTTSWRRLVAEAHEHVRRFDWPDVAERTAGGLRRAGRRPPPAPELGWSAWRPA